MEVDPCELGVVVQHLLEVGHEPGRVGRVAVESAPQLVVDAAVGHCVQGPERHGQSTGIGTRPAVGAGRAAQQELDRHRLRELRRAAPPSPRGVEGRLECSDRRIELRTVRQRSCPGGRIRPGVTDQLFDQMGAG